MFDLAEYIKEKYGSREEHGSRQRLIQQQQNQSSAELADPVYDPTVRIQQPNVNQDNTQQGNVPQNNVLNPNAQVQGETINYAALTLTLILYVIAISLMVYGAIHLNDCPAQNMIAISFIVLGGLSLISRILASPQEYRSIFNIAHDASKSLSLLCLNMVVQIILLCFFLSICYWIFSIKPDTKPEQHDSPNYCEQQFYRDTYYGCIVGLVLFGLIFIGLCCGIYIIICAVIAGVDDDDD